MPNHRTKPDSAADALAAIERARALEADRKTTWGDDNRVAMTRLCNLFPTLVGVPGTDPWTPHELLRWLLTSGGPTSGSVHAAKFVLQVWNSAADWQALARAPVEDDGLGIDDARLTPFNVVAALGTWDHEHTSAFLRWAYTPFWP